MSDVCLSHYAMRACPPDFALAFPYTYHDPSLMTLARFLLGHLVPFPAPCPADLAFLKDLQICQGPIGLLPQCLGLYYGLAAVD